MKQKIEVFPECQAAQAGPIFIPAQTPASTGLRVPEAASKVLKCCFDQVIRPSGRHLLRGWLQASLIFHSWKSKGKLRTCNQTTPSTAIPELRPVRVPQSLKINLFSNSCAGEGRILQRCSLTGTRCFKAERP